MFAVHGSPDVEFDTKRQAQNPTKHQRIIICTRASRRTPWHTARVAVETARRPSAAVQLPSVRNSPQTAHSTLLEIMLKPANSTRSIERGLWSGDEHDRFLEGLKLYPHGPWKKIAFYVGTRSPRQVQTHAQKYYEKVGRRLRGLRKDRKKLVRAEHRLDEDMVQLCQLAKDRKDPSGQVDPTLASRLRAPLSSPSKLAQEQHKSFQEELQAATLMCSEPPSPCPSSSSSSASATTDSDAGVDLSDFDDSCLDFLIEVLGGMDSSSGGNFVVTV